ncbi:hypothetical protein Tco_0186192 [Tanacetum coccineum]
MNRIVFNCTEEDYVGKPLYNSFLKTDNFKGVPHPLTGDYTLKPQREIDESLYVYGKKGPQKPETSISDDTFSENSVTTNEKVVSEPTPKEVEPSCVTHVKTLRQPMKNQGTPKVNRTNRNEIMERELGEGYSFIRKKCFVCDSLSHLIKNCEFYEKKMAREAELKKQRVFNTSNGVAKPIWNNANRVNHANHFVPRPVQLIAVRQNVNSVRPNVNTGRVNVNSVRTKQPVPTSNSNSFSSIRPQDHPLKNMEDRGIFDSGCSAHMTGNKDHLDDFEECKGGSVTFGGSKGYITEERPMTVDDLLQLVPKLMTKKVKKMEVVLKRRHVVLTDSEEKDAKNSSKQGRNLQEEGLDEMVRSIMKEKSEEFETPTQGKTSGEADISPEGLEAAETLAKVLTQRTKTYTRKVKTGLRRKLDADEVSTGEGINTGFTDVNTAFEEINSGNESIIPSPKKEIVRLQAQEEAENARKAELERQDALIAKRVQDELELSETQKNRMDQVQEAANDDFAKKMAELINEKKRLYKEQRER